MSSLECLDCVCRFDRFVQVDGIDNVGDSDLATGGSLSGQPPLFTTAYFAHQESESGTIRLAFQQPGIYYYGATPSYQGRAGRCTAGGEYDGRPSPHPTAIVVAGPHGEVNASLPSGFAGPVHHTLPLASPHQFCIINNNITLFSGCKAYVPLCRPDAKQEIPPQPRFASVIVPSWLEVHPESNDTSAYTAILNNSVDISGRRRRYTFQSTRWSTYNDFVPL